MNRLVSGLFVICVLISSTNPSRSAEEDGSVIDLQESANVVQQKVLPLRNVETNQDASGGVAESQGRSLSDDDEEEKKSKPLRSIFMGIYKNYKSTYLGNKTLTEYKQTLRETMKNKQQKLQQNESIPGEEEDEESQDEDEQELLEMEANADDDDADEAVVTEEYFELPAFATTTVAPESEEPTNPPTTRKRKQEKTKTPRPEEQHYNVGPALNMSLDLNNSIVKVNLDGESLKELVTGRWLSDSTEEGRGKKYEMVTRILPLFILPFLIQSAIVPFLVTKLKLLLMKSMLVGKLAIFLLIISAFRNSNKMMQTYEVAPSYWASEPSRRSEMAAAASNMAYNGYRVEGKPAAWVN